MKTIDARIKHSMRMGHLMFKYIRRELTPKQEKELIAWRKSSPINEQCFQDALDPEKMFQSLKAIHDSRELMWEKFKKRFSHLL